MASPTWARVIAGIAVAAAALTASAGVATATPATPADSGAAGPLAPFYEQTLQWSRCSAGQCAWLTVPLDYADPAGRTIRLRLSRTPASDRAARIGSLVTNPGGPGAEGVSFGDYLAGSLPADVTRHYDIVGFDPRGVGQSAPIVCMDGRQTTRLNRTDVTPDSPREISILMERARALAEGCLARTPELARHIGTDNTVRDMDILRQALGDEQLNFLGYSYGTYLAAEYAELFPDRVGRFVLDGAVDPNLDMMRLSQDQSEGFQLALSRFADDCASRSRCPWTGDGSAVLEGIDRLLRKLDSRPLPGLSGEPLVQAEALTAVFYSMYSPQLWPLLRSALREARQGDGSELSTLYSYATERTGPDRYGSNMASAFPAIACWDRPAPPGAPGLAAAARRWSRGVAVPELARAMAWGNAPCSVWFGHTSRPVEPARSTTAAPMLIIGGLHDPATPYAWAQALHRQLPTSVLLTFTGDGHTAYGNGSDCVDPAVDAYLVHGTLPAPDTRCR